VNRGGFVVQEYLCTRLLNKNIFVKITIDTYVIHYALYLALCFELKNNQYLELIII